MIITMISHNDNDNNDKSKLNVKNLGGKQGVLKAV